MRECPTCGSSQPSGTDVCAHCGTTLDGNDVRADSGQPDDRNRQRRRRQPAQQPEQNQPRQGRQPPQQPQNQRQQQQPRGQQPQQGRQPQQGQPSQGRPPQGGGPSRQPPGGGDDGFTRREMLVGGVALTGLAGGGWVLLGDGDPPLVSSGDDERASPDGAIQAYVDALQARDEAALRDTIHEQSPLDEPKDGDLDDIQDMTFALENATVVEEEISEDTTEYDSVQAFEVVEFTLAIEGEQQSGGTEKHTQSFIVAQNQNGEWKLWDKPTTVTTQTEDTGTESTEQVANNLNIVSEVGIVGPNNSIVELRLGVRPASGSGDIDLSKLTLQYVSDEDFANVVVGEDTSTGEQAQGDTTPADIQSVAGENNYLVDVVTATKGDDIVMTDRDDRYELVVPLSEDRTANPQPELSPLEEGMEVEITITTEVGSQVVSFMQVPDSLAGKEPGYTVNL